MREPTSTEGLNASGEVSGTNGGRSGVSHNWSASPTPAPHIAPPAALRGRLVGRCLQELYLFLELPILGLQEAKLPAQLLDLLMQGGVLLVLLP